MRARRPAAVTGPGATAGHPGGGLPERSIRPTVLERWRSELSLSAGGALDRTRLDSPRRWPGPRVDLTPSDTVDPAAVRMLLAGRTVRLSQLVIPNAFPAVARRVRAVDRAARAARERHGLDLVRIVLGTVTWDGDDGDADDADGLIDAGGRADAPDPSAPSGPASTDAGAATGVDRLEGRSTPVLPALVAGVELSLRSGDDADLTVRGRWELAPGVLDRLAREGVEVDPGVVLGPEGGGRLALDRLQRAGAVLPGFRVNQRVLLGVLPFLGRCALDELDELAGSLTGAGGDLVAALGGDPAAVEAVRRSSEQAMAGAVDGDLGDVAVLGADARQRAVVEAVVTGGHAVVASSPGSGTARTVVHLVAALAARGRSVLVVADERATLRRVVDLLGVAGLGDLVVDVQAAGSPETAAARRTLAERVLAGTTGWVGVGEPGPDPDAARRAELETVLTRYDRSLHRVRDPWGISAHEAVGELLALDRSGASTVGGGPVTIELPRRVVAGISHRDLEAVGEELAEWVRGGGAATARGEGVWAGSMGLVTTDGQVAEVAELARRLALDEIPAVRDELARFDGVVEIGAPLSLRTAEELVGLLGEMGGLLERYRVEVFDLGDDPAAGVAPADTSRGPSGWRGRRSARRAGRAARTALVSFRVDGGELSPDQAIDDLRSVERVRAAWRDLAPGRPLPRAVPSLEAAHRTLRAVVEGLARLSGYAPAVGALRAGATLDELGERVGQLVDGVDQLAALPRLHRLRHRLEARELVPILDEVATRELDPDGAVVLLRRSWLQTVLHEIELVDDSIGSVDGASLDRAADELARLEVRRRVRAPVRVRSQVAARAATTVASHPASIERLRQASTDGAVARRDLLAAAATPLLAAVPAWFTTPHVIAEVFPLVSSSRPDTTVDEVTARGVGLVFDVVVLVGADRMSVAEVIPAVLRGRQAVVLGDPRRRDAEGSCFSAMSELLPSTRRFTLPWFHRRGDGRLAQLAEMVGGGDPADLLAVPSPGAGPPVRLVGVGDEALSSLTGGVVAEVVATVVDLVVEHAVRDPHRSLAVVATSEELAERVAAGVRAARPDDRVLDRLLADPADEPVIVRSVGGLAGELRDHVILVVDPAPAAELPPVRLVGPGADDDVVGAVSAARHLLTVVSTGDPPDAVPIRSSSRSATLLSLAGSGGVPVDRVTRADPLLVDVAERLRGRGVPVELVPGRVPELTLQHRADPGRPLLAVLGDRPLHDALVPVVDRECLLPEHLTRLGWAWHRIRTVEWVRAAEVELDRLVDVWQRLH